MGPRPSTLRLGLCGCILLALAGTSTAAETCSDENLRKAVPDNAEPIRLSFNSPRNLGWGDVFYINRARLGDQVAVPGLLIPPPKAKRPFPVVVLISDSYAYNVSNTRYVSELAARGIGAFVFDTYCPRGLRDVKGNQAALSGITTLSDAYRALRLLAQRSDVDDKKIGLAGWSRGGTMTILAADQRIRDQFSDNGLTFRAGVSVYGSCIQHLADKTPSPMRLLVQLGTRDGWATVDQCRPVLQKMSKSGFNVRVHEYDALHGWDIDQQGEFSLPSEIGFGKCDMIVDAKANIVEQTTGLEIRSGDDFVKATRLCGKVGVSVGGNRHVAEQSRREFGEFFDLHLNGTGK